MTRFAFLLQRILPSVALAACSGASTVSGDGELDIVIATAGSPADPDGYTLVVRRAEGAVHVTEQAVATAATVILPSVEPGMVNVELRGLAANCAVQGEHPRPVEVRTLVGTRVDIAVQCGSGA